MNTISPASTPEMISTCLASEMPVVTGTGQYLSASPGTPVMDASRSMASAGRSYRWTNTTACLFPSASSTDFTAVVGTSTQSLDWLVTTE